MASLATAAASSKVNGKPTAPRPKHAARRRAVDLAAIERAVHQILVAVGEDPQREGLRDTPLRVARMYAEVFEGLAIDPARHTRVRFTEKYDEIVLVKEIPFYSMCEHHLLPFAGHAHVAYIPNGQVIGISKLARVVDSFARRPQVQERLTTQIADLLNRELKPRGVAVVIEAVHSCMTIRGVRKPGSKVTTSAMLGGFRTNIASRAELMNLIQGGTK